MRRSIFIIHKQVGELDFDITTPEDVMTQNREYYVSVLPGKTSRTHVESRGLQISKDANLASFFQFTCWFTLQMRNYDAIIDFVLIQRHWRCHLKRATSSCPDKDAYCKIANVYQVSVQQCS